MACEFCGKTLRDKKSLNKHVMAKHKRDECKHNCDLCGKRFAIRRVLIRHIAAMHTNNPNSRANLPVNENLLETLLFYLAYSSAIVDEGSHVGMPVLQ